MAAKLLQGAAVASEIKERLKKDVENLKSQGVTPHLAAVQVGSSSASSVYIKQQQKA